jgi:hypothetical protein
MSEEHRHVPEGCTPADALVLRRANHAFAQEAVVLQTVFLDLLNQVDAFIATYGEADFYTAPARAMRAQIVGRQPPEYLQAGLDRFLAERGITKEQA